MTTEDRAEVVLSEEGIQRIVDDLALSDEASELAMLLRDHAYVPSGLRGVSKCACGLACHGMPHEWRNHVATVLDAHLASIVAARVEEARAEAWDEGYAAGEHMAHCWGHVDHWEDPPTNPYRAALASPDTTGEATT
jgi:hypothetical protein